MKTLFFKLLIPLSILLAAVLTSSAQIYVKVRPPAPVIVRPPQPSHVHVWIEHDWTPEGDRYRYVGGRWEIAPHPGEIYYKGHWKHHPSKGYIWIHGGWRKK